MKGFVPTPPMTVDLMIERLFRGRRPDPTDRVLDPGCGEGAFIEGIMRWCMKNRVPPPRITGVESDPNHVGVLRQRFRSDSCVRILQEDFLLDKQGTYDYIVGNPPYVAITGLSTAEKEAYRAQYATARGRFDLYMLFFERALANLAPDGRLVFITPEKFLYVDSGRPLRRLLAQNQVETIDLVSEDTFGELVTYPTITAVRNAYPGATWITRRNGTQVEVRLPEDGGSWLPLLGQRKAPAGDMTLADVCVRISCGVATGADRVFVRSAFSLPSSLRPFARPTVAGRELLAASTAMPRHHVMLLPYDTKGRLLPQEDLGALGDYLAEDTTRRRLLARTCVQRKPWYAFHETPALQEMLRPKILFKDICATPQFWVDWTGEVVPRHSVYYLVPENLEALRILRDYLESRGAHDWLFDNCQRAAKGYLRLQSRVLQRMPLPEPIALRLQSGCLDAAGPIPKRTEERALVETMSR